TVIRQSVRLREAAASGVPVQVLDPGCGAARDFESLAGEIRSPLRAAVVAPPAARRRVTATARSTATLPTQTRGTMDGLALLCNLHADGPWTLRRLRGLEVHTLQDLERVPLETLVSWLGAPRARRFAEEARLLARRLVEVPLEPEEFSAETGPAAAV